MHFSPKRLTDWMAEVDAQPAPRWLLRDFLADDSLTMISGHPKSLGRKSLLAMAQCLALATNSTIAAFEPTRQVPVLYCYHEAAAKATSLRFHMLCQGLGVDKREVAQFWMLHRSLLDLRSKADVQTIGSWCRDNKIGVVVFDTLAKSMLGSEDDAENIGRVIRGIEEARSYGLSVLILHHLSKQTPSLVGGNCDPDRDMRGSGALAGAYETHQAVRHYGYNHQRADLLVQSKDGEEFAHKHWWEFLNTKLPNGEADRERCSTKLYMGPRISWAEIGVLDADEVRELMAYMMLGSNYTPEMLATVWKVPKHTANELLAKLIAQGLMESAKYGYRVKDTE